MKKTLLICCILSVFGILPAQADNFRCPNGAIVSTGDSLTTVAMKCDTPAFTSRREEPMAADFTQPDGHTKSRVVYVEVQEWAYNQGDSTLLHTLLFRGGTLVEIKTGGFTK